MGPGPDSFAPEGANLLDLLGNSGHVHFRTRGSAIITFMLESLGLDSDVEQVYLRLLETGATPITELASICAMPAAKSRAAVRRLVALGLVTQSADRPAIVLPAQPGSALESLALQRERDIAAARNGAKELQRSFGNRNRQAAELVEILHSREQIQQRYFQLQQAATTEILNFDAPPYSVEPDNIDVELARLSAGISYRVIYSSEAFEHSQRLAVLSRLAEAGQQTRCLIRVPIKLVIADRKTALLPLQAEASEALSGAVVVHQSSLLDMLLLVFEEHWRRAVPLDAAVSRVEDDLTRARPTVSERRILALLAAGQKDEAVARQLGITVRTVRRHMHDLCELTDSGSRFQLALRARERGWL